MCSRTAHPTGRTVLPALLLPLALAALTTDAAAQDWRGPKHGQVGGWINNPTGNNRQPRLEMSFEFRGETPAITKARLTIGLPKIEATSTGTRLQLPEGLNQILGLVMAAKDGPTRCRVQLPTGFAGGLLLVHTDNGMGAVLPTVSESFLMNVPALLGLAAHAGVNRFSLTFLAYRDGRLDSLRLDLLVHQAASTIEVRL